MQTQQVSVSLSQIDIEKCSYTVLENLLKYGLSYLVKLLHCFTANGIAATVKMGPCSYRKKRL